jgi:hypothetical protein
MRRNVNRTVANPTYRRIGHRALEVAEPGIVSTAEWRPEPADDPLPSREDTAGWCLVARKP